MTVCSYCGRSHGDPNAKRSDTFCPHCLFCRRYVEEAQQQGISFKEWLDQNQDEINGLVDDLKNEMKNLVVWEGDDKNEKEIDPEIKKLYIDRVIRRACSEVQAELQELKPDRR